MKIHIIELKIGELKLIRMMKKSTYTIEILNGIHAPCFPSRFWPYAKLCLLKVDRKATTRTPLCRWKAITSRSKCLTPATTRTGKCEIIDNHLQWMNIDANLWEIRYTRCNRRISPLITFIGRTFILVPRSTIMIHGIVFTLSYIGLDRDFQN